MQKVETRMSSSKNQTGIWEFAELLPIPFVAVQSGENVILLANDLFCEMLHMPKNQVIGQPLSNFLTDYAKSMSKKGVTEADMYIKTARGQKGVRVSTKNAEIGGEPLTLITAAETGTAGTDAQLTLQKLASSNADLEQFVYIVSHDLQEPLRMINGYVQLIKDRYAGKLDKDAEEFIGFATDGASRLQQMIQDLLLYSRVQTRGKALVDTDSQKALDQAIDNLKFDIDETKAKITAGPMPMVKADHAQVAMLFQNLLGNAIKFRSSVPEIRVTAEPDGEYYRFCIQDNGIGIDPQFFDRIFAIFRKLHTREEYPGTGMGLAVSKRIVGRHEGEIWVESESGHGSRFYFTMPRAERGN